LEIGKWNPEKGTTLKKAVDARKEIDMKLESMN
jgi:hypothetical protein